MELYYQIMAAGLGTASAILLTMVGFFLAGLYKQFRRLVDSVAHIDKTVALHGNQIRQLLGLDPLLEDGP